jgi:carotenoid cleavage dioxygenase
MNSEIDMNGEDPLLSDRRTLLAAGGAAFALSLCGKAAKAAPTKAPPTFTQGHYRQQLRELTLNSLEVAGTVPTTISGVYMRNGHNPKPELVPPYWFAGNGMLHGIRISGGKAHWYRNRWVRTPALHGAPLVRKDGSFDLTASAAATSVYAHAGRIYALQEVNLPFLVSPELETLGPFSFDGKLAAPMTAHPKIDPVTGEMLFISYGPKPPFLTYFRVSPEGVLTHQEAVPGAGPSIMHDFAITPNYVIFFDPSVVFDANSRVPFPYTWDDRYQAKVGVMPRDRSKGPVKWYPADPFFFFHIANAWENPDGTINLESTLYDKAGWDRFGKWLMSLSGHPPWLVQGDRFARWTVDPRAGTVKRAARTDISNDFPTINQKLLGRRTRFTYAEAFPGTGGLRHNALIKIDGQTGDVAVREYPDGQQPEEPWFVPDPQGVAEDDGWLFSYVSDVRTNRSRLEIIAANAFNGRPQAVVSLPSWVPAGVHGSWIDDAVVGGA